jgi:hypothetical protein
LKNISVGKPKSLEYAPQKESPCKPGIKDARRYKNGNAKKNTKTKPMVDMDNTGTDCDYDAWKNLDVFEFDLRQLFM